MWRVGWVGGCGVYVVGKVWHVACGRFFACCCVLDPPAMLQVLTNPSSVGVLEGCSRL